MLCVEAWRGLGEGASDQAECKYFDFLTTGSFALGAPHLGTSSVPRGGDVSASEGGAFSGVRCASLLFSPLVPSSSSPA